MVDHLAHHKRRSYQIVFRFYVTKFKFTIVVHFKPFLFHLKCSELIK